MKSKNLKTLRDEIQQTLQDINNSLGNVSTDKINIGSWDYKKLTILGQEILKLKKMIGLDDTEKLEMTIDKQERELKKNEKSQATVTRASIRRRLRTWAKDTTHKFRDDIVIVSVGIVENEAKPPRLECEWCYEDDALLIRRRWPDDVRSNLTKMTDYRHHNKPWFQFKLDLSAHTVNRIKYSAFETFKYIFGASAQPKKRIKMSEKALEPDRLTAHPFWEGTRLPSSKPSQGKLHYDRGMRVEEMLDALAAQKKERKAAQREYNSLVRKLLRR